MAYSVKKKYELRHRHRFTEGKKNFHDIKRFPVINYNKCLNNKTDYNYLMDLHAPLKLTNLNPIQYNSDILHYTAHEVKIKI